ncbi:MAG: cation:dicarboxylase symporter family transporter, partial [Candidatus Moraniibacteriota bacterium]
TDSSVATMPLSIKTAQEKLKVRSSISQFIIPVGATINMDATALFQGVATVFIAQVYSLELGMGALLILVATAVGSSIGTPATPGVGIIVLSAVLKSVGVPLEGLALIIGVDRILEMFRTSINVTGDLTASVVMNRIIPGRSYKEEMEYQKEVEKKQEESGEDVITGEVEADGFLSSVFDKVTNFFHHDKEEANK